MKEEETRSGPRITKETQGGRGEKSFKRVFWIGDRTSGQGLAKKEGNGKGESDRMSPKSQNQGRGDEKLAVKGKRESRPK